MIKADRSVFWVRAVLLLYVLAISVLAFLPSTQTPSLDISDKIQHCAAFLVLALISDFAFPEMKGRLSLLAAVVAYGVFIELVQIGLPTREFSWLDIVADGLGVFIYKLGREALRIYRPDITQ